jgi:hypothetical protein
MLNQTVRAELVEALLFLPFNGTEEMTAPFGWLAKPAAQDRLRQAQGERLMVAR